MTDMLAISTSGNVHRIMRGPHSSIDYATYATRSTGVDICGCPLDRRLVLAVGEFSALGGCAPNPVGTALYGSTLYGTVVVWNDSDRPLTTGQVEMVEAAARTWRASPERLAVTIARWARQEQARI